MNLRERTAAILNFEEPDKIAYYDWFWAETIERWKKEGMPNECAPYSPMHSHWGYGAYLEGLPLEIGIRTISSDISPRYEHLILDRNEEKTTMRDEWGVKTQFWNNRSGMPDALEPSVRNLDDFKEKIEPLMDPEAPNRFSSSHFAHRSDFEQIIKKLQKMYFVCFSLTGPFELFRHVLGSKIDIALIRIMKDRKFTAHVMNFLGNFIAKTAKSAADMVDGFMLLDDLGYRNGPFFAPSTFEELLKPIYTEIAAPLRRNHLPVILHSCGNVKPHIPHLIDAGITALNPLEVKAGMDVVELKEKYGESLVFIGNIDVRTLESTPQEIEQEVKRKIAAAGQGGGYIVGSDHSIPPTVSFQNYMHFLRVIQKYG